MYVEEIDGRKVYRVTAVSAIKNKWLRRLGMFALCPVLMVANIGLWAYGTTLNLLAFVLRAIFVLLRGQWYCVESIGRRWNTPWTPDELPGETSIAYTVSIATELEPQP